MPHRNIPHNIELPAIPWKNSLLTKEEPDNLQNPVVFFAKIVHDNDTFSILYSDLSKRREEGLTLTYEDTEDMKVKHLCAFLVIQDIRGVNWICPVNAHTDPIDQRLCPLDLGMDEHALPFRTMESFGEITMTQNDYISSCSRGFENASKILLGDESVRLHIGFRLIACFYFFPKGQG